MYDNTIFTIELVLVLVLYMVPTLVAVARDVPQRPRITVLNIVLGWTIIGYIIAFLWAALAETQADELS